MRKNVDLRSILEFILDRCLLPRFLENLQQRLLVGNSLIEITASLSAAGTP